MDRNSDLGRTVTELLGSQIASSRPVNGGDVAVAYQLTLDDGRTVFAKTHANPPAGFFETEAIGLEWLRAADAALVPQVLGWSNDPPLLILEWIDESRGSSTDERAFGEQLARLHQAGAPCFGREDRRTTGSRGLPNEPWTRWSDFYATQRLLPLLTLADADQIYSADELAVFEAVAGRLDIVGGPDEPPARLHGDLWAGNRLIDGDARSWLIDPACHGGHREFDLAMMALFGGFGAEAFAGYQASSPLAQGWQQRVELHQLAPLLVHAIKFRGHYVSAALAAAQRYA